MTLSANWYKDQFPIPRFLWSDFIMNYYEHRLMEIRQQIAALSIREDAEEQINILKLERDQILEQIQGE
ncbi:hypothetical protein [Methanosphaera sp.]|uniref:hypothetical protein n=1 Tax=Methanosphaera sp. TaxID=2666342 RepID=UPI0025F73120|nr:hypothetical protein [Methanosphaera sp.]